MDFKECVEKRRSVRKFQDKTVSRNVVSEIVAEAGYAPSWKNSQTTRYIVLDDRTKIDMVAEECTLGFDHNKNILKQTPCVVVVCTIDKLSGYEKDGAPTTSKGSHWQSFDAGIATQTFCLAAHDKGLGSVILGIFDEEKVKSCVGVPEGQSVSAIVAVGYPDQTPNTPPKKSVEDLLVFG